MFIWMMLIFFFKHSVNSNCLIFTKTFKDCLRLFPLAWCIRFICLSFAYLISATFFGSVNIFPLVFSMFSYQNRLCAISFTPPFWRIFITMKWSNCLIVHLTYLAFQGLIHHTLLKTVKTLRHFWRYSSHATIELTLPYHTVRVLLPVVIWKTYSSIYRE